ncbi:MAG: metallophosphoesterase family protein [Thiotrichales bacterium]
MKKKRKRGTFQFIHAADIHLDSPLKGLQKYEGAPVGEVRAATRRAFSRLVDLAIEEEVNFIILAGDLYDGEWKDISTGQFFLKEVSRLDKVGIRVYVLEGNHDAQSKISRSLPLPDNVFKFSVSAPESFSVEEIGVVLHGQGFKQPAVTKDLTQNYPPAVTGEFNIGVLHTSLDGRPGHANYAPCTVTALKSRGYQYWALGHVHQHEIVHVDPWIIFPGNIQGRHIREQGAKGCVLVEVADGEVRSVVHQALDDLRWYTLSIDLGGISDELQAHQQIKTALKQLCAADENRVAAVRVILSGATVLHKSIHSARDKWDMDVRALATAVSQERLWIEKLRVETSLPGDRTSGHKQMDELLSAINHNEIDEDTLEGIQSDLQHLAKKIPPVLRHGEDGFNPVSEDAVASALEQARALLDARLNLLIKPTNK